MTRFNFLNPISAVIIICFLLTIAFGTVVLLPRFQELGQVREAIVRKEQERQHQGDYFSELEKIKGELEKYQEQLSKIDSALPDSPELPSLFSFLQKVSSESGLILTEINPFTVSLIEGNHKIKEIQFGLQVAGPYASFKHFLSVLEESARMIGIKNVSFLSPGAGELFTFNLSIGVHSY